jgi:hypothetical protein
VAVIDRALQPVEWMPLNGRQGRCDPAAAAAARTEESKPMLKWLVLLMVVLAYLAATVSAGAPRDRDQDGLPDRWERKNHLSPTTPSAKRDPDGDHLSNRRELRLRTYPRRADTDRDRLRDGAEVRRFHTNPRKRDTDGDGFQASMLEGATGAAEAPGSAPARTWAELVRAVARAEAGDGAGVRPPVLRLLQHVGSDGLVFESVVGVGSPGWQPVRLE